jgi:hypothetical protein
VDKPNGKGNQRNSRRVAAPVSFPGVAGLSAPLSAQATCEILDLVLGPIDLTDETIREAMLRTEQAAAGNEPLALRARAAAKRGTRLPLGTTPIASNRRTARPATRTRAGVATGLGPATLPQARTGLLVFNAHDIRAKPFDAVVLQSTPFLAGREQWHRRTKALHLVTAGNRGQPAADLIEGHARRSGAGSGAPAPVPLAVIPGALIVAMILPAPLALPALVRPALHAAHGVCRLRRLRPHEGAQSSAEGQGREQRNEAATAGSGGQRGRQAVELASVHPGSYARRALAPHGCDRTMTTNCAGFRTRQDSRSTGVAGGDRFWGTARDAAGSPARTTHTLDCHS